jgi:hypothetical protein
VANDGASSAEPPLPKPSNHRSESGTNWRAGISACLGFEKAGEHPKNPPLQIAVSNYLDHVETLKKPNTLRKYRAVLERFAEYFTNRSNVQDISAEDLNRFIVDLMKNQHMAANTVIHNVIIVAQFFKRQGRPNITRELHLTWTDYDAPLRVP